jgi:hypothetical protein
MLSLVYWSAQMVSNAVAGELLNNMLDNGRGAGNALNPAILISAGVATFVAAVVSIIGIGFQLKVSAR